MFRPLPFKSVQTLRLLRPPTENVTRKTVFDINPIREQPNAGRASFSQIRKLHLVVDLRVCWSWGVRRLLAGAGYQFVDYDDREYVWANPQVMAGLSWPAGLGLHGLFTQPTGIRSPGCRTCWTRNYLDVRRRPSRDQCAVPRRQHRACCSSLNRMMGLRRDDRRNRTIHRPEVEH